MKLTPKNTVDALRMLHREGAIQEDDPDDVKEQLQSMAVIYVAKHDAGEIAEPWGEWYANADINAMEEAELLGEKKEPAPEPVSVAEALAEEDPGPTPGSGVA